MDERKRDRDLAGKQSIVWCLLMGLQIMCLDSMLQIQLGYSFVDNSVWKILYTFLYIPLCFLNDGIVREEIIISLQGSDLQYI